MQDCLTKLSSYDISNVPEWDSMKLYEGKQMCVCLFLLEGEDSNCIPQQIHISIIHSIFYVLRILQEI